MNAKRKPPQKVRSIASRHEQPGPDIITQADLASVSSLQAAEWRASQMVQKANLRIASRLLAGARIEPGGLTFDRDLGMVRREKAVGE